MFRCSSFVVVLALVATTGCYVIELPDEFRPFSTNVVVTVDASSHSTPTTGGDGGQDGGGNNNGGNGNGGGGSATECEHVESFAIDAEGALYAGEEYAFSVVTNAPIADLSLVIHFPEVDSNPIPMNSDDGVTWTVTAYLDPEQGYGAGGTMSFSLLNSGGKCLIGETRHFE